MTNRIQKYQCGIDYIAQAKEDLVDNLFILSASYEDRCTAVSETLYRDYQVEDAIIFYNKEFIGRGNTKNKLRSLKSKVQKFAHRFNEMGTTLTDDSNIILAFHNYILSNGIKLEGKIVTIDITTFPRQELLLLLRYIRMLNSNGTIRILYATPNKYGSWQSKGFKNVITVPSFAGTQIPGRKKLLIILAGFEEERMLKLWDEHEPSKTILVVGNPPTSKDFLRINKMKSRMLLNRPNVIEEQVPADDPFQFCQRMEAILSEHKRDYNIFVAPMNTKIQTVGLFLLFEKYSWFQITLGVPNDYNVNNYSEGAKTVYEFYI